MTNLPVEQARRFWVYLARKSGWKHDVTTRGGRFSDANRHEGEGLRYILREFESLYTGQHSHTYFESPDAVPSGLNAEQLAALVQFLDGNERSAESRYEAKRYEHRTEAWEEEDWEQIGDAMMIYRDTKQRLFRIMLPAASADNSSGARLTFKNGDKIIVRVVSESRVLSETEGTFTNDSFPGDEETQSL